MSEKALIQITRVSTAGAVDEIEVELLVKGRLIRVALSLENFMRVLTGEAKLPCRVVRNKAISDKEFPHG